MSRDGALVEGDLTSFVDHTNIPVHDRAALDCVRKRGGHRKRRSESQLKIVLETCLEHENEGLFVVSRVHGKCFKFSDVAV